MSLKQKRGKRNKNGYGKTRKNAIGGDNTPTPLKLLKDKLRAELKDNHSKGKDNHSKVNYTLNRLKLCQDPNKKDIVCEIKKTYQESSIIENQMGENILRNLFDTMRHFENVNPFSIEKEELDRRMQQLLELIKQHNNYKKYVLYLLNNLHDINKANIHL